MAVLSTFFELTNKQLAVSVQGPAGISLPTFAQEEIVTLDIGVIKQISTLGNQQFEQINPAGWSLALSVGQVAGSILAQQLTFTVDPVTMKFVGTLDLNTAGITALTDRQTGVYLEFLLTDSLGSKYRKRFDAVVEKSIYLASSLNPVVSDTAIGRLEADRTYVKKQGAAGEGFILKSADGTKQIFVYCDDDGSLQSAPIT